MIGGVDAEFRVGEWIVEPSLNRLTLRDRSVHVEPKIMRVLVTLAARPGDVVSREDLTRTVWPDTFVTDDVVTRSISELRKVFADSARQPRFIETIPKSGYRIIAPVSNGVAEPEPEPERVAARPAAPPAPIARERSRPARSGLYAGLGVAALALAALLAAPRTGRPDAPAPPPRLVPLTTLAGYETEPAFSPDGTRVAFAWYAERWEDVGIYVKEVGGEALTRLTPELGKDEPAPNSPAWSHDGRLVVYARTSHHETDDGGLYVVPSTGGPERRILSGLSWSDMWYSPGLDWSPDGTSIAFPNQAGPGQPYAIYLLSPETLEVRQVTRPEARAGDVYPVFSPDGKTIAFSRVAQGASDVWVVPAAGGEPRRVTFDDKLIHDLGWSEDGRDVIFSSNRAGGWALWRVAVAGGELRPVAPMPEYASNVAVARRGDRLAFNRWYNDADVYRVATDGTSAPVRFLSSTREDYGAEASPDGRRVAFVSDRSGRSRVWVCDADGSNLAPLSDLGVSHEGTVSWSPDSQRLVFTSDEGGPPQVYVADVRGGEPRRLTTGATTACPQWSRDGRWIYFGSERSGAWQIWKVPAEGGAPVQVTKAGGMRAVESFDGQRLFVAKQDDCRLFEVRLADGREAPVAGLEDQQFAPMTWAIARDGVFFRRFAGPGRLGIDRFDLATREVTPVCKLDATGAMPGISISSDGREMLFTQSVTLNGDLMLLQGIR